MALQPESIDIKYESIKEYVFGLLDSPATFHLRTNESFNSLPCSLPAHLEYQFPGGVGSGRLATGGGDIGDEESEDCCPLQNFHHENLRNVQTDQDLELLDNASQFHTR